MRRCCFVCNGSPVKGEPFCFECGREIILPLLHEQLEKGDEDDLMGGLDPDVVRVRIQTLSEKLGV